MKLHFGSKDGGPKSTVTMYGFESKRLGSVLLLRFADGSRDAYHTHAFNAVSWVLRGSLFEKILHARCGSWLYPQARPYWTPRSRFHKVVSEGTTWVLSFRGTWERTWREYLPAENRYVLLADGREVVD